MQPIINYLTCCTPPPQKTIRNWQLEHLFLASRFQIYRKSLGCLEVVLYRTNSAFTCMSAKQSNTNTSYSAVLRSNMLVSFFLFNVYFSPSKAPPATTSSNRKNHKNSARPITAGALNEAEHRNRFLFLIESIYGCNIDVHLTDGRIMSGSFEGLSAPAVRPAVILLNDYSVVRNWFRCFMEL